MRLLTRVTRLEALKAPGPSPVAMLIHRRPGEPKKQAAERYFTEYPERRGIPGPQEFISPSLIQRLTHEKRTEQENHQT